MKGTQYTKAQVNEAIYEVCVHQFKKDAKESHAIVEAAGYEISKYDGDWRFYNAETDRRVYMHVVRRYNDYGADYISGNGNTYDRRGGWRIKASKKFDFVGYLDKPLNEEWARMHSWMFSANRYETQASKLNSARRDLKYYTEQIASVQEALEKQVAELQRKLVYYSEQKVKAEMRLQEVRKELGLC